MDRIPAILDDLYAGALDQQAWSKALGALVDFVRGSAVVIFGFNPTTGQVLRDESHRFDPEVLKTYRSRYASRDIRIQPGLRIPIGTAMSEIGLLSAGQWKRSEIYNELLMPGDAPWVLAYWLYKTAQKVVLMSIQGTRKRGPFDGFDADRIGPLIPHVRRVLEIKDRLEFADVRSSNLARTLHSLKFGVLLLDKAGCVLEANGYAEMLVSAGCGLRVSSDRKLWLRPPAGTQFNRWIGNGDSSGDNQGGLLHIPRPSKSPISIAITPLCEESFSWFSQAAPGWIVLLVDPDLEMPLSIELTARDLGISIREAEIAALLATGCKIEVIANRLNISIHTVRTHLKAIFAKTGHHSQTELILRIRNSPTWLRVLRPDSSS